MSTVLFWLLVDHLGFRNERPEVSDRSDPDRGSVGAADPRSGVHDVPACASRGFRRTRATCSQEIRQTTEARMLAIGLLCGEHHLLETPMFMPV